MERTQALDVGLQAVDSVLVIFMIPVGRHSSQAAGRPRRCTLERLLWDYLLVDRTTAPRDLAPCKLAA